MSYNVKEICREIIDYVRENNYERINSFIIEERIDCINKAIDAMLEAGVEENTVILMLQKHWDLRLSEATDLIQDRKLIE